MKLISNMATDYSLMVREARDAILNPGGRGTNFKSRGRIYATRDTILKSGAQYWGPQGLDFLTMLAPGAGPAK